MSEEELLKMAKTDEGAVEDLLNLYKPLVIKLARRYFLICGELDDLVQEGMIGLFKAIQTYDSAKDTSFKTFATICITRKLQSAVRKANNKKNSMFFELFDNAEMFDIPSDKENPEKFAISMQKYDYINKEIQTRLSSFEQEILQKYFSGLSYIQIANDLNITKKSVDNALSRIRSKLSHLLDDTNY